MTQTILNSFDNRVDFGNLEANITFLERTGVLRKDQKILEIGSGVGRLLSHLFTEGFNICGIEINEEMVNKSRKIYGEILPLEIVKPGKLPFPNHHFDIVLSFDVLEHIPDTIQHLQEVYRILRPGGYYLFQTPNKITNTIFETIRWKSFTKWKKDHCSLQNYFDIIYKFRKIGFKVQFITTPIITDWFTIKLQHYLGAGGLVILRILNPEKLPMIFKPNFYVKAVKKL